MGLIASLSAVPPDEALSWPSRVPDLQEETSEFFLQPSSPRAWQQLSGSGAAPRSGGSSSAASSSARLSADLRPFVLDHKTLKMLRLIGEGSFCKVRVAGLAG